MIITDKKRTVLDNYNYVLTHKNQQELCKNCVFFGSAEVKDPCWLCAVNYLEIVRVSTLGHCDKFSSNGKIGWLKQLLLKMEGFKFENKVR